ncbi:hypothetical protein L210DRAFT_3649966 [Boletus edulis BED1]|uniref:Uncharacterized protein n=1 Tax=Boletus edulis BED1 TaxID=1328754 RepID=A0AAD4GB23_BOLED|nr:hypothetical protein L210DRAFT_3649966 [Boletus edulis BED1]
MPSKLVVGFDQIGSYILPSSGTTFVERGSSQVNIVAKDEKWAFTLLVTSTPDGTFLPFQQVWGGVSVQSLPSAKAQGMDKAYEYGFDFTFVKSDKKGSHFSTLKTMKEIEHVFEPYRHHVIKTDPFLDDDQCAIIFLDCYPVHAGEQFHNTFLKSSHMLSFVLFQPVAQTSFSQPMLV